MAALSTLARYFSLPGGLVVTIRQLETAKRNGAVAVVWMPPWDFLMLTTPQGRDPRWFVEKAQPLSLYNAWTEDGEIRIMPSLWVDLHTARVKTHEGRHRAGSLIDPISPRFVVMPVAVYLQEGGTVVYYDELGPPTYDKKFYGLTELPHTLRGQHDPEVLVELSRKGAKRLWTREEG